MIEHTNHPLDIKSKSMNAFEISQTKAVVMPAASQPFQISYGRYFATAYDMWLGKFIGGTFGTDFEGFKNLLDVNVEEMLPLQIVENDDTDLQILWLHALQEHGPKLDASHLVEEWREHVKVPWGEYGVAFANWERGIRPPLSGTVDNWFYGNGMGCPIRSEIWGIICPGAPEWAAKYARQDAELDHGNESIQAEMFLAAIEAAVFREKELGTLLAIGLENVDASSRFADLVRQVVEWSKTRSWQEVRALILRDFGHPDFTNSPQNLGFTILALIAGGGDFVKTMNIAINCSYDTDCTAASAGAILNAICGTAALPESIRNAAITEYKISDWMKGFPRSGNLIELTHACCKVGVEVSQYTETEITDQEAMPAVAKLPVKTQLTPPIRPVENPFPSWIVVGPFFRDWTEVAPQHPEYPDHGCAKLPSVKYMTQVHSSFDVQHIDCAAATTEGLNRAALPVEFVYHLGSTESTVSLDQLPDAGGPCTYYLYSEFQAPKAVKNWLLAGSTGPVEIWFNGDCVVRSSTYQPMSPCTFDREVQLKQSTNRVLLKLEKTSQIPEAFIQFKHHAEKHWHQCFINTEINWSSLQ